MSGAVSVLHLVLMKSSQKVPRVLFLKVLDRKDTTSDLTFLLAWSILPLSPRPQQGDAFSGGMLDSSI